jgi:DNA-binding XRE family transcriptional regulator
MNRRQSGHPISIRYPDGYAVFAELAMSVLGRADNGGIPIERWTDEYFDTFRQRIRRFFVETRNDTNAARFRMKVANEGVIVDRADIATDTQYIRSHLKLIEPEAIRALEVLRERVMNPRTRDGMLFHLREWRDATLDPNIPPLVLARNLRELLQNDLMTVQSDGVTRGMQEALERARFDTDKHDWPTAQGVANSHAGAEYWTYELMPDSAAKDRAALIPAPDLDEKVRQAMATYAKSLGDRESDLMMLLMAKFAERARHPDDKVTIYLSEVMSALGYSKHASGNSGESFTTKDKAVVREQINGLEGGYLTIRKAGREPGRRPVDIESRVLAIWDRDGGQADFDERIRDWNRFTVSFGRAWSTRLFDVRGRMTALLQAQALAYDAIKERIEKRLLKRLGWYWRINNDHPVTAPRTVADWVRADVGDDPATYLRRDAERLEQAFDRLRADGHIADWRYVGGEPCITDTDGALVRGWLERWLERQLVVEAPEALRMAYAARRKAVAAPPAPPPALQAPDTSDDIGQRLRKGRTRYCLTGLQAAGQLGIDPTTLSKIENGKRAPTAEQRERIEALLRELKNRPGKVRDLHG